MDNDIIGIKITSSDQLTKCISIVRKYEPLSIAEIKSRIESSKYVLECQAIDDEGIKKIISCYKELTKLNISCELFEYDGRPTTLEILCNTLDMYDEIAKETEETIDKEVSEQKQ